MTPKEKSKELILKYINIMPILSNQTVNLIKSHAKQCALIAVKELILDTDASSPFEELRLKFWQDVKSEIEKL